MTHETYHRYATLFDAYAAVAKVDANLNDLTLYDRDAGPALREWARVRRLDVEPDTMEHVDMTAGSRWSWTRLKVAVGSGHISAHLSDDITVPTGDVAAPAPQPEPELEMPF